MNTIKIKINNWEKYNPRRDYKTWWFALSNDFFYDPKLVSFNYAERLFYIYLLCESSKSQSNTIDFNPKHAAKMGGFDENELDCLILTLTKAQLIETSDDNRITNETVREPVRTVQYSTEQNSTLLAPRSKKLDHVAESGKVKIFKPENVEELESNIDEETLERWQTLYPDDAYRHRELIKCFGYYQNNKNKKPATLRGWKQAIGGWYDRGWSRHASSIPTTRPTYQNGNYQSPGPRPIAYPSHEKVMREREEFNEREFGKSPIDKEREETNAKIQKLLAKNVKVL